MSISKYIAAGLFIAVSLFCLISKAHAEVVQFEESGAGAVYKIDGKTATPVEAEAAAPKHIITRCTPKKGATDINGKSVGAYTCKIVALMYNPKTGLPKWKTR